jgi:anti-sigma B factor antagonist
VHRNGSDTRAESKDRGTIALKPFSIECVEPQEGEPQFVEIRISGFLDAHTVVSFEKSMDELIQREHTKFLMDLGDLNYISSAGIGALMVLLQQLRRRQGDMVILQPSPKVYKILELLGFTKIFNITQDREAAVEALA